jgi:uncharacterized protein YcaQ
LVDLQRGLRILPIGVAQAGRWNYAFIYELVDRWLPDVAHQARAITRGEARAHLTDLYLRSVGAATLPKIASLFGWRLEEARKAMARLVAAGAATACDAVGGEMGEWGVTGRMKVEG